MTSYLPGLLDRLMGECTPVPATAQAGRAGAEQVRDSVARDLEALLNTRVGHRPGQLAAYPLARASILDYGLVDVAAFCLSSSEDRAALCASLKEAIERHEPRLTNVSATLEAEQGGVNRLHFVIDATLRAGAGADGAHADPVHFDAVLQPSTLRYAISRRHRAPRT